MTYEFVCWFILLLWVLFGVPWGIPAAGSGFNGIRPIGGGVLTLILFVIIGMVIFHGWPIHN